MKFNRFLWRLANKHKNLIRQVQHKLNITDYQLLYVTFAKGLVIGAVVGAVAAPAKATPIPPQQDNPIIQHTMEQPTPLETLINDVLVDCGSTYYHLDGCSLGYRGVTWKQTRYTTAGMCSWNMEDPIYVNITLDGDRLTIGRLGSQPTTYAPIKDNNIVVDSNNQTWFYQSHPTNDRTPAFTLNNTDSIHSISCIGFYNGHPIPNPSY